MCILYFNGQDEESTVSLTYICFVCVNYCLNEDVILISVPNDPRRVIVTELALVVQDREDVCLDLTGTDVKFLT